MESVKFPHTPTNPSGATVVQVGVKDAHQECQIVVPPGVVVFGYENEKTGTGLNKISVGHAWEPPTPPVNGNEIKPIGVSMDGIIAPHQVERNLDSNGRHSIAIGGTVTLCAVLKDGRMPEVLDCLYVKALDKTKSRVSLKYCDMKYYLPSFRVFKSNTPIAPGYHKLGVVHWVNENFDIDKIAEVRIHLDIQTVS